MWCECVPEKGVHDACCRKGVVSTSKLLLGPPSAVRVAVVLTHDLPL